MPVTHEILTHKGAASGYCGLDAGSKVATTNLGSGSPSATTFLAGDQSYKTALTGITVGSTTLTSGTTGSVLFVGSGPILAQNNAKLYFDTTNGRLGVGQNSLSFYLHVEGSGTSTFKGVNTAASSSSGGAGFTISHDGGAALNSGDRIGFLIYAGARDASHTLNNSAAINAYTAEAWTGSACGAYLTFETCATGATTRTERMRINAAGRILIATTVDTQAYSVTINGEAAQTIGMNRRQANNSAGNKVVIRGGGATDTTGGFTLATDKNGGDVEIRGGISTGTGSSGVNLQAYILGSTGTADNSSSTLFRVDGSVAGGAVGFFGVTPVAKQTSGANLTNNVTSGGTTDTIADFTDLTTYANDAAAIRNDIYQLARKLKQVNDALRAYGMLT